MKKSALTRLIGIIIVLAAGLIDGYLSKLFNTTVPDWTTVMWISFGSVGALLTVGIVLIVYSFRMAKKERKQANPSENDNSGDKQ